ncbi:LacI family DNA-binding transcriptional regulator [Rheinheimera sp. 1928-s]|uniref:LacI family DNA-binding transcriptional regulator n=1 Tax=Rheinheimera sp. 1928-s TaxID=3033803 RepID=UPI00261000FF|nr:LacI family DNA-binding transcriptional regulator [Rheinheimera sp. 1928-s]MDF3127115.1 LacI family DNA-binding transcriptional regulator [Rheinheimera sp. 1928-s]
MPVKKPTIKDVARLAGVSFKSVSRVVNNEAWVSDEVKAKVQAVIAQLNYQPNRTARLMRTAPFSLAFVYDNPNSHYVIEMQNGILSQCRKKGFELVIHPTDSASDQVWHELTSMIGTNQIGGVILTPPLSESTELVQQLLAQQAKVVRIVSGAEPPDELCPTIYVDDEQAGQAITEHLLAQGHRRIAFLGYHKDHKSSLGRYRGYCAALENAGIEVQEELVISGNFTFDSGVQMTETLLQQGSAATALFGCNDEIAAGALYAARKRELAVPQDLSIVGFENSPFSRQTWPGLTTVHQPNAEIAAKAASMLIALMLEPEQPPAHCSIKLQLVLRDSVSFID